MRDGDTLNQNMPNFFIVGTVKGGTTSLYEYLKQHPQVFMASPKEPHFFSNLKPSQEYLGKRVVSNRADYLSLFKEASHFNAVGEASTSYLWEKETPYRIKKCIPNAKIIIILRDPIDRAFSHYLMDVRDGLQDRPFYDALLEDYSATEKGYFISHLYVELGMYYKQVKRYIDAFGRQSLLILSFDDFKRDSGMVFGKVARFLEIDIKSIGSIATNRAYNAFAAPRNKVAKLILRNKEISMFGKAFMPRSARNILIERILLSHNKPNMDFQSIKFLRELYNDDMEQLKDLIGWVPYRW